MKRGLRRFLAVLSGLTVPPSAFFAVASIIALATGGDPETGRGVLGGIAVFFSLTGLGGALATWRLWRDGPVNADAAALERPILQLAAESGGRLTVSECALKLAVPLNEARAGLELIARQGHAEVIVTESGETLYAIRGLLSAGEKDRARDLLG